METSRATRESDEEQQCGEWQQTKRSGGAHHEAERRERRRAQGLDGERSEDSDARSEDTERKNAVNVKVGSVNVNRWRRGGARCLESAWKHVNVALEPRLRDTRTEKRRAARRTRRRSARPKGEEGRECRGLTPLAPGPGDVDCSAANTHHSRNQAGVRGWGSRESVPLGVCTF